MLLSIVLCGQIRNVAYRPSFKSALDLIASRSRTPYFLSSAQTFLETLPVTQELTFSVHGIDLPDVHEHQHSIDDTEDEVDDRVGWKSGHGRRPLSRVSVLQLLSCGGTKSSFDFAHKDRRGLMLARGQEKSACACACAVGGREMSMRCEVEVTFFVVVDNGGEKSSGGSGKRS